jgi:hypothetical protein
MLGGLLVATVPTKVSVALVIGLVAILVTIFFREMLVWLLPAIVALTALYFDLLFPLAVGVRAYVSATFIILSLVAVGRRSAVPGPMRPPILLFVLYGLGGAAYGRIVYGSDTGAFPIVIPALILLAGPSIPSARVIPNGMLLLGWVVTIYSAIRFIVLPLAAATQPGHERAFLLALALGCAYACRSSMLAAAAAATLLGSVIVYPAATYIMAVLALLATVWLSSSRQAKSGAFRLAMYAGALVAVPFSIIRVDLLVSTSARYFNLVGKQDNGETRLYFYDTAFRNIDNMLFSEFMTGNITVRGNIGEFSNDVLPVHNDFLALVVSGGWVAAVLFLSIFASLNYVVLGAISKISDGLVRRSVIAILASVNAACVCAFANPVFAQPQLSTMVFALIAVLLGLCHTALELERVSPAERRSSLPASAPPNIATSARMGRGATPR